jgi:catechol 2,3-dioxygenase-like lactoylglutathione lyase family enzyme
MVISGIQQMGVGIPNVHEAWAWYRKFFGMDIKVFEEAAEAGLMLPYTGGEPRSRHAALALNLESGGGFEIWQYTSRTPVGPDFTPQLGDLGIFITKIKSRDVEKAYRNMKDKGGDVIGELRQGPEGKPFFLIRDPYGNIFQIVDGWGWFKNEGKDTGGVFGAVIGVTDMEKSKKFYSEILGYDQVIFEGEGKFDDLDGIEGGSDEFERVILTHSKPREGAFSPILGPSSIELVKVKDRTPRKIFEGRFWGDLGFIHLCFDINGMAELKAKCESLGHPFTVDSSDSFDMGEAAGHFSYIEDPDGALIEFVETHKVPVAKKLNWYIDLRKRDPRKPLKKWLLAAFRMNRVKD